MVHCAGGIVNSTPITTSTMIVRNVFSFKQLNSTLLRRCRSGVPGVLDLGRSATGASAFDTLNMHMDLNVGLFCHFAISVSPQ